MNKELMFMDVWHKTWVEGEVVMVLRPKICGSCWDQFVPRYDEDKEQTLCNACENKRPRQTG